MSRLTLRFRLTLRSGHRLRIRLTFLSKLTLRLGLEFRSWLRLTLRHTFRSKPKLRPKRMPKC